MPTVFTFKHKTFWYTWLFLSRLLLDIKSCFRLFLSERRAIWSVVYVVFTAFCRGRGIETRGSCESRRPSNTKQWLSLLPVRGQQPESDEIVSRGDTDINTTHKLWQTAKHHCQVYSGQAPSQTPFQSSKGPWALEGDFKGHFKGDLEGDLFNYLEIDPEVDGLAILSMT